MIIELHGGQFANKGASKMLFTAMAELGRRIAGARFVVDAAVGTAEERRAAGLETLLLTRGWMGNRWFASRLRLQRLAGCAWAGLIVRRLQPDDTVPFGAVDALVDLAGFAYTDQWGPAPARDFARLAGVYCAAGKPVVLLPQALGPFTDRRTKAAFDRIVRAATLVHARDRQSLAHAEAVSGPWPGFRLCPDMTLPVSATARPAAPERPLILVPNFRVFDRGGIARESYVAAFAEVARVAGDRGAANRATPRLLVHDTTGEDAAVAEDIVETAGGAVEILKEEDPWALKRRLGDAALVVGSRYHALAAALSCGVPAIAIGWAHKYGELLEDFGCQDCLETLDGGPDRLVRRTLDLLEEGENARRRADLRRRMAAISQQVSAMWDEVALALQDGRGSGAR